MPQMHTVFFTIVARNYLAQAFSLGDSIKEHHPDADFAIFVIDDTDHEYEEEIKARGLTPLLPEQLRLKMFDQFVFQYGVIEACTGIKPYVMRYLLAAGATKVLYVDPDVLCYRRFTEVLDSLDKYSVVLTPHSLSPLGDNGPFDDHLFLINGVYNLGFVAVNASATAHAFVEWWAGHLAEHCLIRPDLNLFVDQKWVDLVPAYFDDVLILRSRAYNVAWWNIHERTLTQANDVLSVAESGEPVAFIHFSNVPPDDLDRISTRFPLVADDGKCVPTLRTRPDLAGPFREYAERLRKNGHDKYVHIPYRYDYYVNGEAVLKADRALFLESGRWCREGGNLFEVGVGSFHDYCRAAGGVGRAVLGRKRLAERLAQAVFRWLIKSFGPETVSRLRRFAEAQLVLATHSARAEIEQEERDTGKSNPGAGRDDRDTGAR